MREQEAFAQLEGSLQRAEKLEYVRRQIALLLKDTQDSARLLLLARKALATEDQALAAVAFQRLAAHPDRLNAALNAQAARATLGLRDYRTSANFYFRAMQQSSLLDERRNYYLEGLRALQAAGLYAEAISAADRHIGPLGDDRQTLLFLARLAQAGNMLDAAQRYALQLLKLSLLQQLPQHEILLAGWRGPERRHQPWRAAASAPAILLRVAGAAQTELLQPGKPPGLSFDDEAYTLGYNIFLANRNLVDARRVAESAVRQQPDSAFWRKRMAEVCEWSNAQQDALPHWLAYARLTGEETAWDNVLRLAEGLHDTEPMLVALQRKMALQPGNAEWLNRLLSHFENAGQPERALQLLQARLAERGGAAMSREERRRELVLLADLAERMGRDGDALATWSRVQREFGPDSGHATRIAALLYQQGKVHQAFAALEQATDVAPASDADYWRAYAEVARLLQNNDAASAGYRKLLSADLQSDSDLFNLIALLESEQPLSAARLAMYGFARGGNTRFVLSALNLSLRAGDPAGASRFLESLPAPALSALQQNSQFLSTRANVRQAAGDLAGAERDMRAALALRPDDSQYRAGLLWLLIAMRDTESLKRALALWAHDAENDTDMWGPFAAASMAINRQADALHWYRKPGFLKGDYLWLMSYAEALDANAQPELAWRIRRHAWLDLRKAEVLKQFDPAHLTALRDRLASVAPLFMNGDGAFAVMQALLRADVVSLSALPPLLEAPRDGQELLAHIDRLADTPTPASQQERRHAGALRQISPSVALLAPGVGKRPRDDARMSATVRELALAYALNREAHDLARAWLASRYAEQLARPLWGELSLALATDDRERLNHLLDELPDWLPVVDRIEAARRAGRPELAQTLAFEQMAHLPHDEGLHLSFTNMASLRPPGFDASLTQLRQAPLVRTELRTQFNTDLTPRLKLSLELSQARQSTQDTTVLATVPATDRSMGMTLRFDTETGWLSAAVQGRQAAHAATGLSLAYNLSLDRSMSVIGAIGLNQPATETALLRVGAMRNGLETSVTYAMSRAEYVRLGLGWQRYATQAGTYLGSGRNWNLEAGTHLRIEYPNLTLRAYVSGGSYAESGRFDSQIARLLPAGVDPASYRYLPQDDVLFGLSLGAGTVADTRYTRGWRPFGEAGITFSRTGGTGFGLSGGMAGSLFGQDTLSLRALRTSGTPASPNGFQQIGLDYKWLY